MEPVQPRVAYAKLNTSIINGNIFFYQASPNDRTYARIDIRGLRRQNVSLAIYSNGDGSCNNLGTLLRKPGPSTTIIGRPVAAVKTGDAVVLGNLSPKLSIPPESQSYRVTTSTPYIPLYGPYSVVSNTLALLDANHQPLACGAIRQLNDVEGIGESILGY